LHHDVGIRPFSRALGRDTTLERLPALAAKCRNVSISTEQAKALDCKWQPLGVEWVRTVSHMEVQMGPGRFAGKAE
jgi:hypothetical protein